MSWFSRRSSEDRHNEQQGRLRAAEQHEQKALNRLVQAGVQATMRASEGQEAAEQLAHRMEQRRSEGEAVILTAEHALRILGKGTRQ